MTKRTLAAAVAAIICSVLSLKAQTNIQLFHDAGKDRGHLTTTIEGFYSDKWGSTFFFVDHDFNSRNASDKVYAPSGTYMEISRALNFWSGTRLAPLSLHVEYNGGVYKGYTINNAFLAGAKLFMHNADFRNTLTLHVQAHQLPRLIRSVRQEIPQQTPPPTDRSLGNAGPVRRQGA